MSSFSLSIIYFLIKEGFFGKMTFRKTKSWSWVDFSFLSSTFFIQFNFSILFCILSYSNKVYHDCSSICCICSSTLFNTVYIILLLLIWKIVCNDSFPYCKRRNKNSQSRTWRNCFKGCSKKWYCFRRFVIIICF